MEIQIRTQGLTKQYNLRPGVECSRAFVIAGKIPDPIDRWRKICYI